MSEAFEKVKEEVDKITFGLLAHGNNLFNLDVPKATVLTWKDQDGITVEDMYSTIIDWYNPTTKRKIRCSVEWADDKSMIDVGHVLDSEQEDFAKRGYPEMDSPGTWVAFLSNEGWQVEEVREYLTTLVEWWNRGQ